VEREISQPDIPRPKLHGTENHAALFATRQSWVRHVAPQLGIDEHKQILGETLHKIVGDDSNLFTWASDVYFPAEVAKDAKTGLGIRLVNEISTPEIPDYIKEKLKRTKDRVLAIDWTKREDFNFAGNIWYETRDWVEQEIAEDEKLTEASVYANSNSKALNHYWRIFIYGFDPIEKRG